MDVSVEEYRRRKGLLIEALKSGEYEQGDGFLQKDGRYCCLGVACEVAIREGLPVSKKCTSPDEGNYAVYEGTYCAVTPPAVKTWYGLKTEYGLFEGEEGSLIDLNDSGTPFSKIADIIDSEPPGLFTWANKEAAS